MRDPSGAIANGLSGLLPHRFWVFDRHAEPQWEDFGTYERCRFAQDTAGAHHGLDPQARVQVILSVDPALGAIELIDRDGVHRTLDYLDNCGWDEDWTSPADPDFRLHDPPVLRLDYDDRVIGFVRPKELIGAAPDSSLSWWLQILDRLPSLQIAYSCDDLGLRDEGSGPGLAVEAWGQCAFHPWHFQASELRPVAVCNQSRALAQTNQRLLTLAESARQPVALMSDWVAAPDRAVPWPVRLQAATRFATETAAMVADATGHRVPMADPDAIDALFRQIAKDAVANVGAHAENASEAEHRVLAGMCGSVRHAHRMADGRRTLDLAVLRETAMQFASQ